MEIITKQYEMNQKGRIVSDQFMKDEDYNVPDSKDDVRRIVMSEAKLHVEELKPSEKYVKVTGKIEFQMLYLTDSVEPTFASLEGKIPLEEMVYNVEDCRHL